MSENVTLAPFSSFVNDSSAVATANANNSLIETAFTDCLSLSGEQPNQMESNLDMNNFNIINLPAPATVNSPVRLTDIVALQNGTTVTISTLPTGGAQNATLVKNSSSNYDTVWTLTPSGWTSLGVTTLNGTTINVLGTAVFSGSSSGTTTVQASASASGTITLPAATDTLVGKATTDTLTNKTFDTAGTGNVFKAGGVTTSTVTGTGAIVLGTSPSITTPVITGVTDGSSAASGKVGEYLESNIAVGSAISTGATASAGGTAGTNLTSLVLTAGDWDVSGVVTFQPNSATNVIAAYGCSLSTTTGTADFTNGRASSHTTANTAATSNNGLGTSAGTGTGSIIARVGPCRFSSNGSQTIFLVGQLIWTTSTQPTMYGNIHARRVR